MKRTTKRLLSVILSVCVMLALALPALAAGDGDDPNVYVNKGKYVADEWVDTDSFFIFDPAGGTLTIDDRGNGVPVNDEAAFYAWIKTIAPGVKTVYIPKTSELHNFSIGETTEEDIEFWGEDYQNVYASNVFWKAFSCLYNLERFEVEAGNMEFEAKDGVLYTRHCYDLVHYPAAKPDKTYTVDKWCLMSIYPYAFCNTRFLERLELAYSHCGNSDFMVVWEYAFSALDPDSGEPRESSIKEIAYYGTGEEFAKVISYYEGNDAARQAKLDCRKTDFVHDLIAYIKANYFIYFRMQLDWLRYLTPGN